MSAASAMHSKVAAIREQIRILQNELKEIEGHATIIEAEGWLLEEVVVEAEHRDEANVTFPKGITSMREWGLTLIDFGKVYKNRSYVDLATSTSEKDIRYKKWIAALAAPSPLITDFQQYLHFYDLMHPTPDGITIPGTDKVRRFAPYTSEPTASEPC